MTIYITKEEYEKLKQELEYLKNVEAKRIAERLKAAVDFGDLTENAEYEDALIAKERLDKKISEIERILREAKIIKNQKKSDKILPGITFEVLEKESQKKYIFTLVGYGQSDPKSGKISTESPLGKAFLNKKPGEEVIVNVPKGKIEYKILRIINN